MVRCYGDAVLFIKVLVEILEYLLCYYSSRLQRKSSWSLADDEVMTYYHINLSHLSLWKLFRIATRAWKFHACGLACGLMIAFLFQHNARGIMSMANSGPNTNGSQFFITYAKQPHLNGLYTVFGKVIHGFEVLDIMEKVIKVIHTWICAWSPGVLCTSFLCVWLHF